MATSSERMEGSLMVRLGLLEVALACWSNLEGEERLRFHFLHVSTDEVYGTSGPTRLFTEETVYTGGASGATGYRRV
jgi:dTDP-D-glucose 4,6-dehydratase